MSGLVLAASAVTCATLSGCGQKGNLMQPRSPAAIGRATLPETLFPSFPIGPASAPSKSEQPVLPEAPEPSLAEP